MGQPGRRGKDDPSYHRPVLASEVVDVFRPLAGGLIVDATFGGGGHSKAILDALPDVRIVAIDRDPDASSAVPPDPRVRFVPGRYSKIRSLLGNDDPEVAGSSIPVVSGVLFDLGVSSHQLDTASRGFSFRQRGPLDMRMGGSELSAAVIVNEWSEQRLANTIRRWGEEPQASRIARAIVAHRPITDTLHLAEVVADAMPAAVRRRRHPARRTFQAIRIAVNEEIDELETALDEAIDMVRPGGRVAVITYHSIEDRVVARRFRRGTAGCVCPPGLPVCVCASTAGLRSLSRKGVVPSPEEIAINPRARSARLRAVEKVGAAA